MRFVRETVIYQTGSRSSVSVVNAGGKRSLTHPNRDEARSREDDRKRRVNGITGHCTVGCDPCQ